jgi:hypothetical protein
MRAVSPSTSLLNGPRCQHPRAAFHSLKQCEISIADRIAVNVAEAVRSESRQEKILASKRLELTAYMVATSVAPILRTVSHLPHTRSSGSGAHLLTQPTTYQTISATLVKLSLLYRTLYSHHPELLWGIPS